MNDFTKEELQLILSDVAQCDMEYSRTRCQEELMTKLQSLIDNYCQHESDGKLYKYSSHCVNPPVFECTKCGEFYR